VHREPSYTSLENAIGRTLGNSTSWMGAGAELSSGVTVIICRLEANGRTPMDEQTKTEIWDVAAGTFIAVSVFSSMAYFIASAIH